MQPVPPRAAPRDQPATRPSQFDPFAQEAETMSTSSRWRRFASMVTQLALVALIAVAAGLFVFPLD